MSKEINSIINQVKPTWSKDLTIRFLYVKLAPCFQRDLIFFLADEEEKIRQLNQGIVNRFPFVICATLADFYVDLFNQFGINAKKVIANSSKIPLYAVIVEGDYGWYYLDPLGDLFSNQYGLKSDFFGIIPRYKTINRNHPELIKLDPIYVSELDKTLNFPKYLNEYFLNLHKNIADRNKSYEFFGLEKGESENLIHLKLQFCNDELINLGNVNGAFERALLYLFLNKTLLNKTEKDFVGVKIEGGVENPYISYEVRYKDNIILYEEQKNENKYVLSKVS